jgi:hypothetical protein
MENLLPHPTSEIVTGSSDSGISKRISRLQKEGRLRKIAPRIYTSNFTDSPESIIRRNLFFILGLQYPGAVLSYRSAFERQPTEMGIIFLSYTYTKKIILPGIVLSFQMGPGPVEGDEVLSGELFVSQTARAYLENLQSSKRKGGFSKCLSPAVIERMLEQTFTDELSDIKASAKKLADTLKMETEYSRLEKMIDNILSGKTSQKKSSEDIAIQIPQTNTEHPFDKKRLVLFENLFDTLQKNSFPDRPEKNVSEEAFRNFAFFESYFSNHIEGTVFTMEEATKIIDTNTPLPDRVVDSYDLLRTYQVVSSRKEMSWVPVTSAEFIHILLLRHKFLLGKKQDKEPGHFKSKNRTVGKTHFVDADNVKGTLTESFEFYSKLKHPFARAIYLMFVISEVHPYLDANGRMARIMMNAELVKGGQTKIMIPAVYSDDYIGSLQVLTKHGVPEPYIEVMQKAQQFCATVYGEDFAGMQQHLEKSNAFLEHTEGSLKIL